jgi:uncharacterized protein YfaS (alpha-2-macroglobulin family)
MEEHMFHDNDHIADFADDYVHQVLDGADSAYVERHCESCASCKAAVDAAERRLRELRAVPPVEASERLIRKTLERIGTHDQRRAHRKYLVRIALAAAAAVLVLIGVQVHFNRLSAGQFDLQVIGQNQFEAGSTGSLRVQVINRQTGAAVEGVPVSIELRDGAGVPVQLASFSTDARGTGRPSFTVPDWNEQNGVLRIIADLPDRSQGTVNQQVKVTRSWKLMLSTDKPVYQPGQEIQVRSLALRRADRKPIAGERVVFSITDPKGNVIFKQERRTSQFGIASCSCLLATEVIEGPYTIVCKQGDTESRQSVEVKKYVLPKFKIDIELDKPFYRPGQVVQGTVKADYFFGKPVRDAAVKIDVAFAASKQLALAGHTDAEGKALFSFPINMNWHQGQITLTAEVRDSAEQIQMRSVSRPVTRESLHIEAMPENGSLVPGIPNQIYAFVTYPDGRPAAKTPVWISSRDEHFKKQLQTDDLGIAVVEVLPTDRELSFTFAAGDDQRAFTFAVGRPTQDFLMRTDRAVYKGGDTMHLTFLGGGSGTVFIDLIKDGQTLLTDSVEIKNDQGALDIDLAADCVGTLELQAYRLNSQGEVLRKSRVLYVQPTEDVRIATTLDAEEYRPGKAARVRFALTDAQGRPTPGALSLAAVDEAVFSVLPQTPGMERTFYTVERELLAPVYRVYPSWSPSFRRGPPLEEVARFEQALFATTAASTTEQRPQPTRGQPFRTPAAQTASRQPYSLTLSSFVSRTDEIEATQKRAATWFVVAWILLGIVSLGLGIAAVVLFMPPAVVQEKTNSSQPSIRPSLLGLLALVFFVAICVGLLLPASQKARQAARVFREANLETTVAEPRAEVGLDPKADDWHPNAAPAARVREHFPETLLWKPELITDDSGQATLDLALADSITTWRLSASAITTDGRLGAATAPIKVFQPFFVDLNLPVSLTRGDEVSVPVAIYNYLARPQTVELDLEQASWFERTGAATQRVELAANEVRSIAYRIRVLKVGRHHLQVAARAEKLADAIRREIEVVPDGRRVEQVVTDRLDGEVRQTFTIPADAVPDSSKILVKIYPGVYAQVIEGIDGMLQMPHGCFEQTSSSTYPNLLVLDYLRKTRSNPQALARAEQYLHVGYQRLLTFENAGGGFDWWGKGPPVIWLTAYGLLEFHDMSKVYPIDVNVITRTQQWLLSQQAADGTWSNIGPTHGETIGRAGNPRLLLTCYVAWALAESGVRSTQLERSIHFIRRQAPQERSAYTLALAANALAAWDQQHDSTHAILRRLEEQRKDRPEWKASYYASGAQTLNYSYGNSADVETTALATLAMLKAGGHPQSINGALTFLLKSKYPGGTWGSTAATVLSLKALVLGMETGRQGKNGSFSIAINGKPAGHGKINDFNAEVMQLFDLGEHTQPGDNEIVIRSEGKLAMMYQIVARHHEPWSKLAPVGQANLNLQVKYDRTELAPGEVLRARATLRNAAQSPANMVMLDLGIPPGFTADAAALEDLVRQGRVARYSITPRQIIIYLVGLNAGGTFEMDYTLRPRFAMKGKTPPATAYEYYTPSNRSTAAPVEVTVREKSRP